MPSKPPAGLTDEEAAQRLRSDGPNVLPSGSRRGLIRIAWNALTPPMFPLLSVTAALCALFGNVGDAGMLALSMVLVGGPSIDQERCTERVLKALKSLSSPRCTIVREGHLLRTGESMPLGKHVGREGDGDLLSAGRMASLGSIVLGNLLLLLWCRGVGVRLAPTSRVFHMSLIGVCVVWGLLPLVPGPGTLFAIPGTYSPGSPWIVLPAGWSLWRLVAASRDH